MRIRTTAATSVVVAALAVGLTACSSSSSSGSSKGTVAAPSSSAAVRPTSTAAAPAAPAAPEVSAPAGAPATPAATGPGGLPPKPDATTTTAYIAALTAIDPEIVGDKADRAVNRGRDQCSSVLLYPQDKAKLVDLTNQRFTSPNHPRGFGTEKSTKILEVVRKHICPTYGV